MSSSTIPSHLVAVCPHCGERGRSHLRHAGRPTRCKACRRIFRLPSPDEAPAVEEPPPPPPPEPLVGFDCRVCRTRMSVPVRYVGRKVKCPDCGVGTVVPEPEAPPPPDIPTALFGEQYEVFEGEDQPHAAELIDGQTKLIPVECRLCQTLMHARADQLGEQLTCPDCGVETVVRAPIATTPQDVLVEAYDVSPPEVVGSETEATRAYLEQAEEEVASQAAVEVFAPRPVMPRFPLVTGVLRFAKTEGALARWLTLSLFLFVWMAAMGVGLATLGLTPGGKIAAFGVAIMGVCAMVFGIFVLVIWFGAFAAHMLAVVVESSEGNDRVYNWPSSNPADWYGEAGYLLVALPAAAAPGGMVGAVVVALMPEASGMTPLSVLGVAVSLVFCFPVVLMSQLAASSAWSVFSPAVVRAMPRAFGSWLLFGIESLMLAAAAAAAVAMIAWRPPLALATAPLLVTVAAVYFRLLGRLAWVVGESAPSC